MNSVLFSTTQTIRTLRTLHTSVRVGVAAAFLALLLTPVTHALAALGPIVTCGNNVTAVECPGGEKCGELKSSMCRSGECICYFDECTMCDLQILAQNIINFLVTALVIMAALLFVNAGVLYVLSPANPGNIARAHKIFTHTLIGLIIVLASYLLIDTVMKALYKGNWGPWNELMCDGTNLRSYCIDKITTATLTGGPTGGPISGPPPPEGEFDTRMLSDKEARKILSENGIDNFGTHAGFVQKGVIDSLVELDKQCGGCMVVTSLAGGGHTTGSGHFRGIKADIKNNQATQNYIYAKWEKGTYRGGKYPGWNYIEPSTGRVCVEEKTHFDCCFNQTDRKCT